MSGQLCLRWNNHSIAFNKLLKNIYLEDDYSDATIMCHGKFFPVHRFVLSTCSEYFEEIFKQCTNLDKKYPFIIVKDIYSEQMESLLHYMYKGEVNVPQDILPELIKAAEALKIKGLAVPDDDEEQLLPKRKRRNVSSPPSVSKKKTYSIEKNDQFSSSQSVVGLNTNNETFSKENSVIPVVKSEPVDNTSEMLDTGDGNLDSNYIIKDESDSNSYSNQDNINPFEYTTTQENISEGSKDHYNDEQKFNSWNDQLEAFEDTDCMEEDVLLRPSFFCEPTLITDNPAGEKQKRKKSVETLFCSFPNCNYKSMKATHMKEHIRTHTGEKPFPCPICSFRSSTKGNLNSHVRSIHSNSKPFKCPHCPHRVTHKHHLKCHIMNRHRNQISIETEETLQST